jgi:hypothetical protein
MTVAGSLDSARAGVPVAVARQPILDRTREFLLEVRPLPLPPGRTVIELLGGQAVDDELLEVLDELRESGFRIALDDFRFDPGWKELVGHADAIKLDAARSASTPSSASSSPIAARPPVRAAREEGALLAGVLAFERGDFEACGSFGIDLLEVAEVYRAALAWVEQAAPHLA